MVEIREEYTGQGEQEKIRRGELFIRVSVVCLYCFRVIACVTHLEHTSDPAKRKAHPPLRVSFDPSKAATKTQIDEGLWKRLNELEKEEEEGGKEEVVESGKEEVMEGGKKGGQEAKGAVHTKSVEAVVVATQGTPTTAEKSSPVSATTTLNAADIGDSCPEQHQPTPIRLLFSHSSSQSIDQPLSRTAEHVSGVFEYPGFCELIPSGAHGHIC